MNKKTADIIGLIFWIVLTYSVATFASQFNPDNWYVSLVKPSWNPPGWIFGPVWSFLYLSMSIATWLVWRKRATIKTHLPIVFYLLQLFINGLWSWLFFKQHMIGIALIDLLLLVLLVSVTTFLYMKIQRLAGLLFIPYLLWICFASILNFQIWRLN